MANKKLSELNESFASNPNDFVLLINKDSRTSKKISVKNLIKVDSSSVLDRYQFSRSDILPFTSSSIELSAGDIDSDFVYHAPTTINISGTDAAEISGQYEFAGIKNNNLYWKNSNNVEINKVNDENYWNFDSASTTLYKFSGQECYPRFGDINLSDESESPTLKFINSRHHKTKESPIVLSSLAGEIDNLFRGVSLLPLDTKEYATVTYLSEQTLYSQSAGDLGMVFTPNTVELDYLSTTGTHNPLSFSKTGDQSAQVVFECSLNGFVIDKVSEKVISPKGDCSFHQNFFKEINASTVITKTGIVVDAPIDLSGFKPANPSFSLDIDGDGAVTYDNDVVLLQRYFAGVSGPELINGLNVSLGTRTTYQEIEDYIQNGIDLNSFDINENGYLDQTDIDLIAFYVVSGEIDTSNALEKNAMTDIQLKNNLLKLF